MKQAVGHRTKKKQRKKRETRERKAVNVKGEKKKIVDRSINSEVMIFRMEKENNAMARETVDPISAPQSQFLPINNSNYP